MYKLGRIVGSLINLALHAYVFYDAYNNFKAGESLILDLIAFVILIDLKEVVRQTNWCYRALEFLAVNEIEKSEKAAAKNKSVARIFNDITKDL